MSCHLKYRLFALSVLILFAQPLFSQDEPKFEWAKNFKVDGGNEDSFANAIARDLAGNVFTTGSFNGRADFDPGVGEYFLSSVTYYEQDIFVSKVDPDGNFLWAVRFGAGDDETGSGIVTDASGNVYITGRIYGTVDFDPGPGTGFVSGVFGVQNSFIVKLDGNGNFVWAKGVRGNSFGAGVTIDNAGNALVTGGFATTVDLDPGAGTIMTSGSGYFIQKFDAGGNLVWAKSSSGSSQGRAIDVDNSNNVLVTGQFTGATDFDPGTGTFTMTPASSDIFVTKLDVDGNFTWAVSMSGAAADQGRGISCDNSGNVFITGIFNNTVDFDPGAGTYNLTASGFNDDIFIEKLDPNANFVWAMSIGGSHGEDDFGNGISVDPSGNVVATGYFNGIADFDPGPGIFNLNSGASTGAFIRDVYVLKLNNAGNFIWAVKLGGPNQPDEGNGVFTDAAGGVYIAGSFSTSMDADFGPCNVQLNASFNADINGFIEKIVLGPTYNPVMTSIVPTSGPPGSIATINGTGFSPVIADNDVKFSLTPVTVSAVTPTTITIIVPSIAATSYNTRLTTGCVSITNGPIFTITSGALPTITSFTPTSGAVNTTVTITGTNFSTTAGNNLVKFNGTTATVTASTATSITTKVPAAATTGTISVTVGGNTATSTGIFTVNSTITITTQPAVTTTLCTGSVATLNTAATGTTNIAYQWQFSTTVTGTYTNIGNGGGYANVTTSVLSINTTGNFGAGYYKCLISGDAATPVLTNAARLIVSTMPATPIAHGDIACDYGSGGIANLYATGGSAGNYRWYMVSTGGTAISGATNSSYSPTVTVTTTYYVSLVSGACESPRVPAIADVKLAPGKPTITSNKPLVNNEVTACPGEVILSGPPGYGGYLWYPVEDNGEHWVVRESGAYTVRVYDGVTGCESEDSDEVNVIIDATNCVNTPPEITLESVSIPINGKVTLDLIPTISDPDNNIDLESLSIVDQPQSGAEATITPEGMLEIDYASVQFSGKDKLRIGVCDYFGECAEQELEVTVIGDIVVYNGISPNKDGANDVWIIQYIDAIEETRGNKVSIYNRWGDEVFTVDNYNNVERVFKGLSKNGSELSSGTYFYKIEFTSGKTSQTGYLTLKK